MDFHASLVDQHVSGFVERHGESLPAGDEGRRRSAAFVVLCMMHYLSMSSEEAVPLLTDGGEDAGVDGIYIGSPRARNFVVTLFQGKYKHSLDGAAEFPGGEVDKIVDSLKSVLDPHQAVAVNPRLRAKIDEARFMIREYCTPTVRVVLCNNGRRWSAAVQGKIEAVEKAYRGKVKFVHFNHDSIVERLQGVDPIDATLRMSGRMVEERLSDIPFIVGRVEVSAVAELMEQYGDALLQRNIRHYLGLADNAVNRAIQETLLAEDMSEKFYFLNNGITMVCDRFDYNVYQQEHHAVRLRNVQIINGGQTCHTIHQTWKNIDAAYRASEFGRFAYVMVRIYQLQQSSEGQHDESSDIFVQKVTLAANSQSPVMLADMRANDRLQKVLEVGMRDLGYTYVRKRGSDRAGKKVVHSATVARAVLAVWREKPHLAKWESEELFGSDAFYADVFDGLSSVQAVVAVEILRWVEIRVRRDDEVFDRVLAEYAVYYIAMLVGRRLLGECGVALAEVTHRDLGDLLGCFSRHQDDFYGAAMRELEAALGRLHGGRRFFLRQLGAIFRRSDLLDEL